MVGEPRHSVDRSEIVVEIDCTDRPTSVDCVDFGVAIFSCVVFAEVDAVD